MGEFTFKNEWIALLVIVSGHVATIVLAYLAYRQGMMNSRQIGGVAKEVDGVKTMAVRQAYELGLAHAKADESGVRRPPQAPPPKHQPPTVLPDDSPPPV